MFDFLTGIVDSFMAVFQAIQGLVSGVVAVVKWIFGLIQYIWGSWVTLVSMIPTNLLYVIYPLLGLACAAAALRAVAWIKGMLPFN